MGRLEATRRQEPSTAIPSCPHFHRCHCAHPRPQLLFLFPLASPSHATPLVEESLTPQRVHSGSTSFAPRLSSWAFGGTLRRLCFQARCRRSTHPLGRVDFGRWSLEWRGVDCCGRLHSVVQPSVSSGINSRDPINACVTSRLTFIGLRMCLPSWLRLIYVFSGWKRCKVFIVSACSCWLLLMLFVLVFCR